MWNLDSARRNSASERRSEIPLRTARRDEPWPGNADRLNHSCRGAVVRMAVGVHSAATSFARDGDGVFAAPRSNPASCTEPRLGTALIARSRSVNRSSDSAMFWGRLPWFTPPYTIGTAASARRTPRWGGSPCSRHRTDERTAPRRTATPGGVSMPRVNIISISEPPSTNGQPAAGG